MNHLLNTKEEKEIYFTQELEREMTPIKKWLVHKLRHNF